VENQISSSLSSVPPTNDQQALRRVINRINLTLERNDLVQETTAHLRQTLQADRVVLYYFYGKWKGQVISESLSRDELSILGSTGADDCFNSEYAALYEAGRVRSIPDIEQETIADCHRDFLRSIKVKSNLAVPILTPNGLWGLLVVHYCSTPHSWTSDEIELVKSAAQVLADTPCISAS
jgi:GAF domain-containing protein